MNDKTRSIDTVNTTETKPLPDCPDCDGTGNFYRHDEDGDFLPCDSCWDGYDSPLTGKAWKATGLSPDMLRRGYR